MYLLQQRQNLNLQDPEDIMDLLIEDSSTPERLRALNRICEADKELISKVMYCIDINRKTVDWYNVFNMDYSPSGYAGLIWAKSIWDGKTMTGKDLIALTVQMTNKMRQAVLEAASYTLDVRVLS